ncbi:MAG: iron ABC transporter permease [Acetatifactor sp.]|nr:iron ABC transporter permease [Acetatifactor sp.]
MKKRRIILYSCISAVLLFLLVANLIIGSADVTLSELFQILLTHDTQSVNGVILWNIRIPRILAAMILGGGLALSGYLLQSFFANPIAGPFVLGISSGAKLFVAILMVAAYSYRFGFGSVQMVAAAFLGAMLATGLVILAAGKVKNMSILIVCGVMIGYVCSAITELLVTFADDSNIVNLHNWSMGSFSAISWQNVESFVPIVFIGTVIAFFMAKDIETYLYGEQYAFSVGMNLRMFRVLLITCSSILSATVTAFAGPISFVGIAVPHVIRSMFRTSKPRIIMSASFLAGAAFCLFCDLLARCLFTPMELSISTITAIFGAPVVISMLLKRKRG